VVGLDELDEAHAFNDATRKQYLSATDLVQIVAKHRDDLVDFGIGGIVGEDDVIVPREITISEFDLLRGGENMGVLCEGTYTEKAKDNQDSGSHSWKISAKITTKLLYLPQN
jgi:hypothetical protein